MATLPPAERFWSYVDFGDRSGCWTWTRSLNRVNGYGRFVVSGKTYKAHRFAWELTHGSIPSGMLVCHSCDNRRCVNPDHLFIGTQKDNIQDAIRKGRRMGIADTKVTADDVIEMRAMMNDGCIQQEVADRFGVDRSFVSKILRGKRWGRVA